MALATGSAMGLWEVKNCTSFRARYICRQSLGTPVTPELPGPDPTPSLTSACPQGWGSDPKLRHCYKVGSLWVLSRFSCVRLCDPIDGSPPGSPVPGILQARTLEWVAISSSALQ